MILETQALKESKAPKGTREILGPKGLLVQILLCRDHKDSKEIKATKEMPECKGPRATLVPLGPRVTKVILGQLELRETKVILD